MLNVCVFSLCVSDYVIEEKTAVLQKRESEGFGFVLRGAKGRNRRMNRWIDGWMDEGVVGVWRCWEGKKKKERYLKQSEVLRGRAGSCKTPRCVS